MLIAINKGYGVLSQFTPEPGSAWRTLADSGLPGGVYPLGRLDADSEGLLLLSDEPGINHRLLDPAEPAHEARRKAARDSQHSMSMSRSHALAQRRRQRPTWRCVRPTCSAMSSLRRPSKAIRMIEARCRSREGAVVAREKARMMSC